MSPEYVLLNRADPLAYLNAPKGRISQKGAGNFTLCEKCNNKTGSKYAVNYAEFAQGLEGAAETLVAGQGARVELEFCPQNVLKQMAVMFLTANPPEFGKNNPDFVDYAAEPTSQILPKRFRFHLALTTRSQSMYSRQSAVTTLARADSGLVTTFSEIAYHPLILVMSFQSSKPDTRLLKVNYFRHYALDRPQKIQLDLFALPIASPWPADYRTEEKVRSEVGASIS
jgi:hypothetical protein